ncbi:tRNA lysidine(34) synthetase TilS [Simiduia aestuariiviva]|uniref:tRNA(Ile)-lysidine synthase n=1 Tax=Simiduia aestuariiviva TaxID=1510459 RepID=A0A839UMD6_9GAMM|nr:tRNA lysidine(34) synthetase TilS [Simiduia aestuariiviva]MBB3167931.1 tRNA(Ile)-lysidine synthase [Simiduia aestuariiviva]
MMPDHGLPSAGAPLALSVEVVNQLATVGPIFLAFSGGLDSTVLLHLLTSSGVPFTALHINHQLSPNADQWQQHCARECAALAVPFEAHRVHIDTGGQGLEAAARASRYAVFEAALAAGGALLTAHHVDDQAETLLLRLVRGAGVAGLGAMSSERPLGQGVLMRPLLGASRAQLQAYAQAHQLRWIDDESNANTAFDRNFLRAQIMPLLQERWPQQAGRLAQAATHCREATQLLTELAEQDAAVLQARDELVGVSVSLEGLRQLSSARQRNVLRHWLAQWRVVLSTEHLALLRHQWLALPTDAQPELVVEGGRLVRFAGRGFWLPHVDLIPPVPVDLYPDQVVAIGDLRLCLRASDATDRGLALPTCGHWHLRPRASGERCHPSSRARSQTLKKCLQEKGLAPWLRQCVPLICDSSDPSAIWAVGDLWREQAAPTGPYAVHWWLENPHC